MNSETNAAVGLLRPAAAGALSTIFLFGCLLAGDGAPAETLRFFGAPGYGEPKTSGCLTNVNASSQ